MTERPMIFNAEMVNAILSSRKTQTRRPIKWKRTRFTEIGEREDGSNWPWSEDTEKVCDYWHPCPFGAVGDRIWVRETFATGLCTKTTLAYRATHKREDLEDGWNETIKWTPSIHMPRWASRILLEITDVRVERLQAITLGDICKEFGCGLYDFHPATYGFQVWEELWESIYGAESWQANPWVWVLEFKRINGGTE
ncbi:hypothetical protein [Citrobacter arsenatis]|uniref:hypothetical protein n=1 Tax=Citrobacter arsenatis TaxID=2546350 RepID=UPI00300DD067